MQAIQEYLVLAVKVANQVIMPVLFALAFIYFAINIFNLFIREADKDLKGRKEAVLYSIAAMVVVLSFWGLVGFFTSGLGLNRVEPVTPDYIKSFTK